MELGFVKLSAACPQVKVGDVEFNLATAKAALDRAEAMGSALLMQLRQHQQVCIRRYCKRVSSLQHCALVRSLQHCALVRSLRYCTQVAFALRRSSAL